MAGLAATGEQELGWGGWLEATGLQLRKADDRRTVLTKTGDRRLVLRKTNDRWPVLRKADDRSGRPATGLHSPVLSKADDRSGMPATNGLVSAQRVDVLIARHPSSTPLLLSLHIQ